MLLYCRARGIKFKFGVSIQDLFYKKYETPKIRNNHQHAIHARKPLQILCFLSSLTMFVGCALVLGEKDEEVNIIKMKPKAVKGLGLGCHWFSRSGSACQIPSTYRLSLIKDLQRMIDTCGNLQNRRKNPNETKTLLNQIKMIALK